MKAKGKPKTKQGKLKKSKEKHGIRNGTPKKN